MSLPRAQRTNDVVRHSNPTSSNSIEDISSRTSNDLIIGLCGTLGSGIHALRTSIESRLSTHGYTVRHIHISSLMKEFFPEVYSGYASQIESDAYNRYKGLQDLGNKLRETYNNHILSEAAIAKISLYREHDEQNETPNRVAYIIDQLKHPSELELFRLIYQHNFYLFGIIRTDSERKRNLRDEGISPSHIDELFHRDRRFGDTNGNGQQTEKTIRDADFFIKNNHSHAAELDQKIGRYIDLIHGVNGITPTMDEKGMYSAYSASMQSACLSRQVGAAIFDEHGNLIVTGRNDVPKFGGGLYSTEDGDKDYRCIHKGAKCYNDFHKEKMRKTIVKITRDFFTRKCLETVTTEDKVIFNKYINNAAIEDLVDEIHESSPINALIEYSRAIHAEMDAITSLARLDGPSSQNKIIYTTTYPCHNCARHIVAAGIKKAIYIEPYEKSLALDLHDDAICDSNSKSPDKVTFEQFEGVSPRRYTTLFLSRTERKDKSGNVIKTTVRYGSHADNQFKDSFIDYELKVVQNFNSKLHILPDAT